MLIASDFTQKRHRWIQKKIRGIYMQICSYKNDNKEGLVWKRKADKQSPTKPAAKGRPAARSQVLFIKTRGEWGQKRIKQRIFPPPS